MLILIDTSSESTRATWSSMKENCSPTLLRPRKLCLIPAKACRFRKHMKLALFFRQWYNPVMLLAFTDCFSSLLEAIEKFLRKKAGRSCFRLICRCLLRLFNRNDGHHPSTRTEGYRTGLQHFLEQLNEVWSFTWYVHRIRIDKPMQSQGSSSEAEATAVTPMQGNQKDTTSSQTPQIPQSASSSADSPSAALGSQYSPTTPSGPGSPSSPVPHPHLHPYSYPSPSSLPYTFPNPFLYPSPYSSSPWPYAHPSPAIVTINLTNIGNDNRTTTPMVDIESLALSGFPLFLSIFPYLFRIFPFYICVDILFVFFVWLSFD